MHCCTFVTAWQQFCRILLRDTDLLEISLGFEVKLSLSKMRDSFVVFSRGYKAERLGGWLEVFRCEGDFERDDTIRVDLMLDARASHHREFSFAAWRTSGLIAVCGASCGLSVTGAIAPDNPDPDTNIAN